MTTIGKHIQQSLISLSDTVEKSRITGKHKDDKAAKVWNNVVDRFEKLADRLIAGKPAIQELQALDAAVVEFGKIEHKNSKSSDHLKEIGERLATVAKKSGVVDTQEYKKLMRDIDAVLPKNIYNAKQDAWKKGTHSETSKGSTALHAWKKGTRSETSKGSTALHHRTIAARAKATDALEKTIKKLEHQIEKASRDERLEGSERAQLDQTLTNFSIRSHNAVSTLSTVADATKLMKSITKQEKSIQQAIKETITQAETSKLKPTDSTNTSGPKKTYAEAAKQKRHVTWADMAGSKAEPAAAPKRVPTTPITAKTQPSVAPRTDKRPDEWTTILRSKPGKQQRLAHNQTAPLQPSHPAASKEAEWTVVSKKEKASASTGTTEQAPTESISKNKRRKEQRYGATATPKSAAEVTPKTSAPTERRGKNAQRRAAREAKFKEQAKAEREQLPSSVMSSSAQAMSTPLKNFVGQKLQGGSPASRFVDLRGKTADTNVSTLTTNEAKQLLLAIVNPSWNPKTTDLSNDLILSQCRHHAKIIKDDLFTALVAQAGVTL